MAIRKDFPEGTKYYYGVITDVTFVKRINDAQGMSHRTNLSLFIKDTKDDSLLEELDPFPFEVPIVKMKPVTTDYETTREDDSGKLVTKTNSITSMIPDESSVDPLSITKQNEQDQNIIKLTYIWLKANVPLFADFEDVLEEE
jgi:hypothetical protein